jgi:hypothetical protein
MAGDLLLRVMVGVMVWVMAACSGAIVLIHLTLAAGVLANAARDTALSKAPALAVSVVVAAKDEEANLPALLARWRPRASAPSRWC